MSTLILKTSSTDASLTFHDLERLVNEKEDEGYTPIGGCCFVAIPVGKNVRFVATQTVHKPDVHV